MKTPFRQLDPDSPIRAYYRAKTAAWKKAHPEQWREIQRRTRLRRRASGKQQEYMRKYWPGYKRLLWKQIFEIYGGQCACCGETNPLFLSLDHIARDGAEHRKRYAGQNSRSRAGNGARVMRDAIRQPDKTRFRILCFNCNLGRERNGGICPHVSPKPGPLFSLGVNGSTAEEKGGTGAHLSAPEGEERVRVEDSVRA